MYPQVGLPSPAPNWALFLDIDGTLVDIAPTPDAVAIPAHVLNALDRTEAALGGALALISGRRLDDVDALTAPRRFSAAGQHGAEWRIDGDTLVHQFGTSGQELEPVRRRFEEFAAANEGILVEDKGTTLAIHFRRAPRHEDAVKALAGELSAGLAHHSMFFGKAVIEFRPDGFDKGQSIDRFLAAPPFAGRVPVYAGDDRTDEDAFAVVNSRGGISIRVGPPPANVPATRARWQCANVAAFTGWLAQLPEQIDECT